MKKKTRKKSLVSKKIISTPKARAKIHTVLSEFKAGELPIGKSKKKVKSRKQAIAIALSEGRKAAGKSRKK